MTNGIAKLTALARRLSAHPALPLAFALAAIILMLPALSAGLLCDDLIQRLKQFTPAESAPGLSEIRLTP